MTAFPAALVIAAATPWTGTPYHHQASLRGVGCDCLGLVRGVWRDLYGTEAPPPPPYSRDWGEVGRREVLLEALRCALRPADGLAPGAVVAFRMMPGALAKHSGIVIAGGRFIHAHERRGVVTEPLTRSWARRVVATFHFPGSL